MFSVLCQVFIYCMLAPRTPFSANSTNHSYLFLFSTQKIRAARTLKVYGQAENADRRWGVMGQDYFPGADSVGHPEYCDPGDLLYFVYLDEFVDDWKRLNPNDGDEFTLWSLEMLLMANPNAFPIVAGTGGLRKARFGREGEGKSGGIRICYSFFPDHHVILMMMAYRKNEQEDLTSDEKKGIKKYLGITKAWLDSHR